MNRFEPVNLLINSTHKGCDRRIIPGGKYFAIKDNKDKDQPYCIILNAGYTEKYIKKAVNELNLGKSCDIDTTMNKYFINSQYCWEFKEDYSSIEV